MRTIKKIYNAHYAPLPGLLTYSPLPSKELSQVDPFLFLNHHGPQNYGLNNSGLPFGPHPHRGMETVTFILDGDIMHKDSGGHESIITAGGVQWMTAGKGLIHAEVSSTEFKKSGGNLEILQLWLNLPAKLKMTEPYYKGLQKDDIPVVSVDNGNVIFNLISGNWFDKKGAFDSITDVSLSTVNMKPNSKFSIDIPVLHNIFFYVIRGKLSVNGKNAQMRQLIEFNNDSELLSVEASEDSIILFGHAKPIGEPVFAHGPFVMNTEEEIYQANRDYMQGKFGIWKE